MQSVKQLTKNKNIIGFGRKRLVYDLQNGYVLKAAKSQEGIASNKTEIFLYKSRRFSAVRSHLGKVTKYGPGYAWLIMKKYTRKFRCSKNNMKQYYKLKNNLRKNGIRPRDMYSMTHKGPSLTNLRLSHRGKVIVIDYGNFRCSRNRH